ncbi:MAG: DUF3145 family protein [Actinobacteria bacterium]|nr:DUF3145 family protein [Actinomycetota bacterium]
MDLLQQPHKRPLALSRGYLVVHSAPGALTRHVEWAISSVLGPQQDFSWKPQPLMAGSYRLVCEWRDREGAGAEITSALRGWHYLRFELREESSTESVLYRYTPELGIHRAVLDGAGSVMVNEHQIMSALALSDDNLREVLAQSIGTEWELELDRFRRVELEANSQSEAM